MPARGWKKTNAKSRVIKLRVDPEFAKRVVCEAGERGDGVSAAIRLAAEVGLDTLDRRRKGLGNDGMLRIELTGAEEATRDIQRRYYEASVRRREAKRNNIVRMKEQIIELLRKHGTCDWWELVAAVGPVRETAPVNAAVVQLLHENRIVKLVSYESRAERMSHFALVPDEGGNAVEAAEGFAFRPSDKRRANEVWEVVREIGRFGRKDLRETFGWRDRQVSAAIVVLIADGRVERIGYGVYRAAKRPGGE